MIDFATDACIYCIWERSMNFAFLFDSSSQKYAGVYGDPILERVLGSGIVQRSSSSVTVLVGDVFNDEHSPQAIYYSGRWSDLLDNRLRATFGESVVFAVAFENMAQEVAFELHGTLVSDDTYLGVVELDYQYGPHIAVFRNSLIPQFCIDGHRCEVLRYATYAEDDPSVEDMVRRWGFTEVVRE